MIQCLWPQPAVIPVVAGPLQVLLAILPGLLAALFGALFALFKPRTAVKCLRLVWSQKIPVAILAAVTVLICYGWGQIPARGDQKAAGPGVSSYPLFRGGLERRGWLPTSVSDDPLDGGRNWAFADGVQTIYSSPAVVDGYVYAVSADTSPFDPTGSGRIFCLDARTGAVVWRDKLDDFRATFSSPAVSDRFVVCGEGLHFTEDSRVVCLDRATGETLWEFRTKSHVESTPCIYKGKVYVGAGDDGYYCLSLEPKDSEQGPVVWHAEGDRYPDAECSPVARDGMLYVGLGNGGNAVCCLDAETGTEEWRLKAPYPVFGPPSISGGRLFVSMGTGNFAQSAEQAWQAKLAQLQEDGAPADKIAEAEQAHRPAGEVWSIDLKTGQKQWAFKTGRIVLGAVAVADGRLYFASRDKNLYCVSTDGQEIARWNARSAIVASPAVTRKHVYVVTQSGMLYGLDAATLEVKWECPLYGKTPAETDLFASSPTVANGRVYVGTPEDGLVCVGKPGQAREPVWAGPLGGPGQSGRADRSVVPSRMKIAWSYPAGDALPLHQVTGPLACHLRSLYVPFQSDEGASLARLDLSQNPGTRAKEAWFVRTDQSVTVSPAVKGRTVYVVTGEKGDEGRKLQALDSGRGETRWSRPVASEATGDFVLSDDRLLVADLARGMSCIALKGEKVGEQVWRYAGGEAAGVPAVADARAAVALAAPSRLALLDAPSGKELWAVPLPSPPQTGPIYEGPFIFVGLEQGVAAFAVLDGHLVWHLPDIGSAQAPLVGVPGRIACTNSNQELILVDTRNGEIVKRVSGVDQVPLLTSDAMFFFRLRGYFKTSLDASGARGSWLRWSSSRQGALQTPAIFAGGAAYFGTDKGLVCALPSD